LKSAPILAFWQAAVTLSLNCTANDRDLGFLPMDYPLVGWPDDNGSLTGSNMTWPGVLTGSAWYGGLVVRGTFWGCCRACGKLSDLANICDSPTERGFILAIREPDVLRHSNGCGERERERSFNYTHTRHIILLPFVPIGC